MFVSMNNTVQTFWEFDLIWDTNVTLTSYILVINIFISFQLASQQPCLCPWSKQDKTFGNSILYLCKNCIWFLLFGTQTRPSYHMVKNKQCVKKKHFPAYDIMIYKREKAHFWLNCVAQKRLCLNPQMMTGIKPPGGGGTPLFALYGYVPLNRVWFSRFCVSIKVYNSTI